MDVGLWLEKFNLQDRFGDVVVDGIIILEWI
jgi:hypothetical protein